MLSRATIGCIACSVSSCVLHSALCSMHHETHLVIPAKAPCHGGHVNRRPRICQARGQSHTGVSGCRMRLTLMEWSSGRVRLTTVRLLRQLHERLPMHMCTPSEMLPIYAFSRGNTRSGVQSCAAYAAANKSTHVRWQRQLSIGNGALLCSSATGGHAMITTARDDCIALAIFDYSRTQACEPLCSLLGVKMHQAQCTVGTVSCDT